MTTHSPRVTSFAYDGARPMYSLRSGVAYGSVKAAGGDPPTQVALQAH